MRWSTGEAGSGEIDAGTVHSALEWDEHVAHELRRVESWGFRFLSVKWDGVVLGVTAVVMTALVLVSGSVSRRDLWFALLGVVAASLAGLLTVWLVLRLRDKKRESGFAARSDDRYRVRVIGHVDELLRLSCEPIDITHGFEPGVYRIACAVEPKWRRWGKLSALCGAGVLAYVILSVLCGDPVPIGYTTLVAGCALGRASRAFVWPTYLRVSPGRLEVMQYGVLGIGKPRVRIHDLRTSRVGLRVNGALIVFPAGSEEGEVFPAASSRWLERMPLEFERTVIAAALTNVEAAPLPDDELIG